VAFDDKAIDIDWILDRDELKLSEKDRKQPLLKDADIFSFKDNLYV